MIFWGKLNAQLKDPLFLGFLCHETPVDRNVPSFTEAPAADPNAFRMVYSGRDIHEEGTIHVTFQTYLLK